MSTQAGRCRVAIVQDYVPEYRAPFFAALRAECERRGIELEVFAGRPNASHKDRGDAAHRSDDLYGRVQSREIALRGRRVTLRRLPRAARSSDVLVLEQSRRNVDVYRLLLPTWMRSGTRVALWGHGRDFVKKPTLLQSYLLSALSRRAWHIFVYTPGGADHLRSVGVSDERITVVMNSTDTVGLRREMASITEAELQDFRTQQGLGDVSLLYLGALDSSKQIPLMLEAFARARRSNSELSLIVAGDGDMRSDVIAAAADPSSGVRHIGHVGGRTKATVLKAATCLVIPGRIGLVAVDALAAGLPILSTSHDLHAPEVEYLHEGESLFTVSPTADDLAHGILCAIARHQRTSAPLQTGEPPNRGLSVQQMAERFASGLEIALNRQPD